MNVPGNCIHEVGSLGLSATKIKSECDLRGKQLGHTTWTNCREVGHCTLCDAPMIEEGIDDAED